ncbi:LLM class flavin-dependent oxidoreductase [Dactylosporangium sp. AC04546]|uniref:LLM class flavin-dependent oxidoreductase n=1 Tax=Dactylosporangium sp. AC04546 TaxID=2862460 RepID=UPI001EDF8650|nr:LLM class flavin-dependent oxidoreductase [Dactylosporangium sp. AC04546]WVK80298.1 LLM class flavin-dependent oxidoreductase [Dactylosporangium sp. AC04546]
MTDYGHELRFGTFLPAEASTADESVRLAVLTETLGLDLTSVQDHPYQGRFLDAWTLLSVVAAATQRISVFPNVANLPLRPPAVLARAAAGLDVLTGGRVELGLGAGAFWDAIVGMGGTRRTPAESLKALEEAVAVLRALWSDERSSRVDGEHYQLRGAHPGPAPAHDIGIWIGGYKPRMLSLIGRVGDGWLPSSPYLPPEQLGEANARIDDAAVAAGRRPQDVLRLYNIAGTFAGRGQEFLQGPPKVWVEQLAELAVSEGVSGFVLMVRAGGDDDLRRFAVEVAPAVRDLVARERSGVSKPAAPAAPVASAPPVIAVSANLATPTPDDGTRLSAVRLWDEAERPAGPALDPALRYTDRQKAKGQHLVDVHNHLREELDQVRDLVRQVAAGSLDVGRARSMINTMAMRQNNWTLGTYCESYCRVVTTHHTIEDVSLFPALRAADPRLAPVVDRLEAEHHVIADVLERVDAALVSLVGKPDGIGEVQEAVDLLTDTLLSHLSYEERELVEPLSRLNVT